MTAEAVPAVPNVEDLIAQVQGMPADAKDNWLKQAYAIRNEVVGPRGPLGVGTRSHPSPGALAADVEPTMGKQTPALELLDRELVAVADGKTPRLQFYMPPQEGKSQRVSRWFVAWLLKMDPTLRIGIVSYEYGKARRWGRQVKRDCARLGIRLAPDAQAAGAWQTPQGGGVICVGIGGSLTGEPIDVLVIDDPVKGRAEAESPTYREAAWDWWEGTGRTRQSARFRAVLIMTRWHHDDLAARMVKEEPGQWRVVSVPAIAEREDDPLGRKPGEPLVSVQDRGEDFYPKMQATASDYVWLSVYQQRPTSAQGNLFKRTSWRYWRPAPSSAGRLRVTVGPTTWWLSDCWRFATVDLAASTKRSADWTVASAWALTPGGELLLLDRVRQRVKEEAHYLLVTPLQERWEVDTVFIEKGFIGSLLVRDLTVAGVKVSPLEPDKDKITRAIPYANRVQQQRVYLRAGAKWLDEWINEHAEFPNGAHDDQVDTGSYAVRVSGMEWNPVGAAAAAAMADRPTTPDGPDLWSQQW